MARRLFLLIPAILASLTGLALGGIEARTDMSPVNKRIKELVKDAASDTAQSWTKRVPGEVIDAKPALGGAYIVLKFKDMAKLAVFSIVENKIVKYFKLLDTESLYAAGGRKLLVFSPSKRILQTYDLLTLERTKSKSFKDDKLITHMEMGLHNEHVAIISFVAGTSALSQRAYGLFDPAKAKVIPFTNDRRFHNSSFRDAIHLRPDAQLKLITCWATSHSPQGVEFITRERTRASSAYEHNSAGHLAPSLDGRHVYSGRGAIYKFKPNNAIKTEGGPAWPILGTEFYLVSRADRSRRDKTPASFVIKDRSSFRVIREIKGSASFQAQPWARNDFTLDRQVIAVGAIDRVVHIDAASRTIHTYRLGLPASSTSAATSGPGPATRGKLWTHALPYKKGSKVIVEDAPEGLAFDEASMSLRWEVPNGQATGSHEILISVTPPGGEERYDRVFVIVK